jgi:DNA polymerase-3 subunit gamma/tau
LQASSPAPAASPAPSPSSHLAVATRSAPQPVEQAEAAPGIRISSMPELVALASAKRDLRLKFALETQVRPVAFEDGRVEIALIPGAPSNLIQELQNKLTEWTGRRWLVALSREEGDETMADKAAAERDAMMTGVRADPLVTAVLARFPGASIVDVRAQAAEEATPTLSPDEYELMAARDEPGPDDDIEF